MSTRSVADPVTAMADAGSADPRAVRDLARRCELRLDALVERISAQWRAYLPGYQSLRDAEHDAALRQAVSDFLRTLQGLATEGDLRVLFRTRAARRAEQGVPLTTLLRTYTIAAYALFEGFREEARPDETAALAEVARQLFVAQDEAVIEVASAYQEELAALGAVRRDRRRELVRDLVTGAALPEAAVLEEFGLGTGATVLAIRLGPLGPQPRADQFQPATSPPAASAPATPQLRRGLPEPAYPEVEVAIRRRLLRVQRALDSHYGRPVPALLEQPGGHALVPHAVGPEAGDAFGAAGPAGPAGLEELSRRLSAVWGDEVRVAIADADRPERIGPAAATATEVLRLVCALGRPPGMYALDDVLLEYHLTRHDESAQPLGALLDPLSDRADLLHTVRVFLDEQYDRRRTARRLGLHPNTVDNRLARVTELTGLDPATPRGVALLMTALALRDLARGGPARGD